MKRKAGARARRARGRTYHHGELREALVRCARTLLERAGPAGMSLRAAARLAGVSPAAPAHHFRNKEGLLAAVATQGFRELIRLRLAAIRTRAAPLEVLRRVLLVQADFAARNPRLFQLMFGSGMLRGGSHAELHQAAIASFELVARVVEDCLDGDLRRGAARAQAVLAVWMMMNGLATAVVHRQVFPASTGPLSPPRLAAAMVRLLAGGLRAAVQS